MISITKDADFDQSDFGRSFEILIGSYLFSLPGILYYWRERNYEVDFIYQFGKNLHAIEVKYGKDRGTKGLEKFPKAKTHLITPDNFEALINGEII